MWLGGANANTKQNLEGKIKFKHLKINILNLKR